MKIKIQTARLTNMTGDEFKGYRMTVLNAETGSLVDEQEFDSIELMNEYRSTKGLGPYSE